MTIPFACVLAYLGIIYLTRFPVVMAQRADPKGYDNHHPRDQQGRLVGWGRRAQAAHQNGFEMFAPFAAGVLIAHVTGCDPRWMSYLSLGFVGSRVLYPILYIADLPSMRSLVWMVGFACAVALYFLPMFR